MIFCLFNLSLMAQAEMKEADTSSVKQDSIYTNVDVKPMFKGSQDSLNKWFRDNLKYPETAKKAGAYGTIIVGFIVEKDGSLTNVKIIKGIGGGCDEEAIKIVKAMPKWDPGKQKCVPVRYQYNLNLIIHTHIAKPL